MLLTSSSYLPPKTYSARDGDNFTTIAAKHGVSLARLTAANPDLNPSRLRIGTGILIPGKVLGKSAPSIVPSHEYGLYTVRNGDNDWTIAKKFGMKASDLRSLNPSVDWLRLQIGEKLRVSGQARPVMTLASQLNPTPKATGTHIVKKGENDWTIARKYGMTPGQLHALNPSIVWTRLQIGAKLQISGKPPAASGGSISTKRVKTAKQGVILRTGPSRDSRRIAVLDSGKMGSVVDRSGDWYKIELASGTKGWIRGDLLKPVSASSLPVSAPGAKTVAKSKPLVAYKPAAASSLIATATANLGIRYRYGGTSRSGFDCSGFTTHVYARHGVSLPRTSIGQSRVGSAVGKSSLSAGDLVFFKTNRGTRVNHVGIYIGNGKFIHASSGGGKVKIDSLNEGYYQRRYAGARRVGNAKIVAKSEPAEKKEPVAEAEKSEAAETAKPAAEPEKQGERPTTVGADRIGR